MTREQWIKQGLPDQPDGVDDDCPDLPDPSKAAERVSAYVAAWGNGLCDVADGKPLYARDLESLARHALASDTPGVAGEASASEQPAGGRREDTARPVEVLDSTVALALNAYRFAASEGDPTERGMRAALSRVAALLAPDSDPEPCPLDHSCDEGDPCGCWCHLHDVAIAECPTYRIVQQQIAAVGKQAARLAAELATARSDLARAHSALRGADPWRHWAPGETPCPSCGHPAKTHQDDGCWHAVTVALPGKDVVCPCAAPRAVEPARESSEEHPEAVCGFCGGPNVSWVAPSPLWNAVMRGGSVNGTDRFGGIVCPTCFARLAEEGGIASFWRLTAERVHVELETVTPSGRVWDEQAWLWREEDTVVPAPWRRPFRAQETPFAGLRAWLESLHNDDDCAAHGEGVRCCFDILDEIVVDGLDGWVVPKVDHDETRPVAADVVEAARRIQGLADQGRAPNQCKDCGTFRLDGAPPILHRCPACGFEGSADLHLRCPGCEERGRSGISSLSADLVAGVVEGAEVVSTAAVADCPAKPFDVADLQKTYDAMSAPEPTGEQSEAGVRRRAAQRGRAVEIASAALARSPGDPVAAIKEIVAESRKLGTEDQTMAPWWSCGNTWTPRTCRSTATDPAARTRAPIDHQCTTPACFPHVCACANCGGRQLPKP